ncbi:MAG TPA: nuclear transport factor 2 family protein [Acidimicrobiales bacterium]
MNQAQRETLRRHLDAEDRHDAVAAASTYVDHAFYENAALGITFRGRDGVSFQYAASYQLIDGLHADYLWQFDGDDYCVQFGRLTGRVAGDLLGVPAPGGDIDLQFVAVIEFAGDEMVGEHIWYDLDQFCAQAGLDAAAVRAAVAASGLADVPEAVG